MPSSYFDEEEDPLKKRQQDAAGGAASPTFAQLQQRGMPRPPAPPTYGGYGATAYGAPAPMAAPPSGQPPPNHPGHGVADPYVHPTGPPTGYAPTGELNQGNLEGYLYDMLANPTATPTYKNAMRRIGGDIDTDASRRGVFYSTIPTGAYGEAGSNLAAGLQGQAYNQLRGYNQDYEQLLAQLLGAS